MERLADIERAKGLAIVLVVFGHLVARQDPVGVCWYEPLRLLIYLFHMPFFMYLSGYVTGLHRPPDTVGGWAALVRRRAVRLLLPFAAFGLLIVLGKRSLAGIAHIDNVPDSIGDGLLGFVWYTDRSPALSVWYLVALFTYSAALPPMLWATSRRIAPIGVLALVLFMLPMAHRAYLDRVGIYFVFFIAGVAASRSAGGWQRLIDRWNGVFLAVFGLALAAMQGGVLGDPAALGWPGWPYKVYLLVFGALSIPALHGLVRGPLLSRARILQRLGGECFAIYLLNTLMIGAAKAAILSVMPWDGANFLLVSVLLMVAGLVGPIALVVPVRAILARPIVRVPA